MLMDHSANGIYTTPPPLGIGDIHNVLTSAMSKKGTLCYEIKHHRDENIMYWENMIFNGRNAINEKRLTRFVA